MAQRQSLALDAQCWAEAHAQGGELYFAVETPFEQFDGGRTKTLFDQPVGVIVKSDKPRGHQRAGDLDNTHPSWLLRAGCWRHGLAYLRHSFMTESPQLQPSRHFA
jgi:hypothetical protein